MKDLFYIIEVSPQWYNLILKRTHYCIACGDDLEMFKRTIHKYVRKYKVPDRVYRVLKGLSDSGHVPPTVYEMREKSYLSGKHLVFEDFIRGVVEEALKENRKDTPYHHTKKKVVKVTPPTTVVNTTTNTKEVKVVVKKITPLKVKRTTTT